jgi:hypothetical protein
LINSCWTGESSLSLLSNDKTNQTKFEFRTDFSDFLIFTISSLTLNDKYSDRREMVEAFIAYEKRKADPRNLREEAESNLSDPSTWGVYAVWITGGAGFAYVKNVIVEPKYASGEWEEIHISLPKFGQAAVDAASTSVDAVSSAADTAATVVDAASSAM